MRELHTFLGKHIYTFRECHWGNKWEWRRGNGGVCASGFSYEVPVVATKKVQEYPMKSVA